MQEQNRQVSRLEGRQNDEGKWDEIRLKVKEIEDVISRRERFGAGFFNWSNRCCAAADGESLASLNEPLTAQRSHIPLDLHTPEVATTGTSMPVAKLEVYPEGTHFTASRSERPTVDVRPLPDFVESISKSKDFRMVKIGVSVLARKGKNFDERVFTSIIHEILTAVVAEYNVGHLLANREALTNEIKEVLIDRAMSMKISVDDVSITTLSVLCEEENYYKAEQDSSSAIIRAQVYPQGTHFTASRSGRPTADICARPDYFESISKSKDFWMVKIGVRVLRRQGQNFDERVLASIIHEILTAVVAEYNVGQLLANREILTNEIKEVLIDRAMSMKISLDDVSVTTLSLFSEEENYKKAEKDSSNAIIRAQGDNNWDKMQTYLTLALVVGLTVLLSVQSLMPSEYLCYIIGVFATVWIFGTVALLCGLFGTYRYEKNFSRHVGRFTFLCFSIFVLYVFFLISKPIEPPTSSFNSPPPSAPSTMAIDYHALFFLALGLIALAGHIYSWVMGCHTGSDI